MSSIAQRLKHEVLEAIPPSIFFLIAFQLLAFTQAMMLRRYGISVSVFFAAAVGALVVAKVVLLLDHVPFINRFPDKPLIYNVLWKTTLYFLAALVVRYLEHLIHFWRQSSGLVEANRHLFSEVIWPYFWTVQLWLLVLLFVYCSLRELCRALGPQRVWAMFFRSPHPAN